MSHPKLPNWLAKFTTVAQAVTTTLTDFDLRHNICQALIDEIEKWVAESKRKKCYCPEKELEHVKDLLIDDIAPWQYIKKTKDDYFIDECAYLCIRVRYTLPLQERKYMDKWLVEEGFYDTFN